MALPCEALFSVLGKKNCSLALCGLSGARWTRFQRRANGLRRREALAPCARGPLWLRVIRTGRHQGAQHLDAALPAGTRAPSPAREEPALQGKVLFLVICKSTVCQRDVCDQLRMSFGVLHPCGGAGGARGLQEHGERHGAWQWQQAARVAVVEQLWLGEMSHAPAWLPAKVSR